MENIATRSAWVALWITISAFGLILLIKGAMSIFGSTFMTTNGDPFGMASPMIAMGIGRILLGLVIIWFCGSQIIKNITRRHISGSTPSKNNPRAATSSMRQISIIIFSIGIALSGYGLIKQGVPLFHYFNNMVHLETSIAKVVTIDKVEGENEAKSGKFIYYIDGDLNQRREGFYEKKFPNQVLSLGRTFEIAYDKKNPSQYYTDKRPPSVAGIVPRILAMLILLGMGSAGIAGVKANMGGASNNTPYGGMKYNQPSHYKPQEFTSNKTNLNQRPNSGFGQR